MPPAATHSTGEPKKFKRSRQASTTCKHRTGSVLFQMFVPYYPTYIVGLQHTTRKNIEWFWITCIHSEHRTKTGQQTFHSKPSRNLKVTFLGNKMRDIRWHFCLQIRHLSGRRPCKQSRSPPQLGHSFFSRWWTHRSNSKAWSFFSGMSPSTIHRAFFPSLVVQILCPLYGAKTCTIPVTGCRQNHLSTSNRFFGSAWKCLESLGPSDLVDKCHRQLLPNPSLQQSCVFPVSPHDCQ